jgi:hypothetical protein
MDTEQKPEIKMIKLYDRADGVRGHFCVGRERNGYHEFWTGTKFSGFGHLYTNEKEAQSIADTLNELFSLRSENKQLKEAIQEIISCQDDPEKSLANLNGAIRDAKQLINSLEKQPS